MDVTMVKRDSLPRPLAIAAVEEAVIVALRSVPLGYSPERYSLPGAGILVISGAEGRKFKVEITQVEGPP